MLTKDLNNISINQLEDQEFRQANKLYEASETVVATSDNSPLLIYLVEVLGCRRIDVRVGETSQNV